MREQQKSMIPLFKVLDEVKSRYVASKNRLVILNYDVAIIPLTALPNISLQPSPALVQALLKLSEDPKNTIFVHSGRSAKQLESSLFPHPHSTEESHCDSSKKIGMSAELGYMCRGPYDDEWQRLSTDLDLSWRDLVKPVLEDFTNRTPGSFIEQKQVSLVWHYRNCDSDYGPLQARELHLHLDSFYHDKHSPIDLQMNDSLSALIIQPCGVSFANVLRKYLSPQPQTPHLTGDERETAKASKHRSLCTEPIDFVLYIGEGTLTEEMIRDIIQAEANTTIYTCTVNKKVSQARYSLENTDDVHRVLVNLIQAEHIPMQTPTATQVGRDIVRHQ
jgi:trehalose 6-phosphate synthase/phosphatase